MKVLVIGGGAREHIIACKLKESGADVFTAASNRNPGLIKQSTEFQLIKETDIESIINYADSKSFDIAFVGPEAPLEAGISDALWNIGVPVVGPSKDAAMIETSKSFMRALMERHEIPGRVINGSFSTQEGIREFINDFESDVVIKPVGLTGGKGVKVVGDQLETNSEAIDYAVDIVKNNYGGGTVVIEEKLIGEEFTVQAFCDGTHVFPMPAVQDHKRAFENDEGPNTGGMGSYSDSNHLLPFIKQNDYDYAVEILQKICEALKSEAREYRGIMYGQFMLTASGPKVVEINARFGDPEVMNVLTLFDDDFLKLSERIANGNGFLPRFRQAATVCKYIVPEGYGISSAAGEPVNIDYDIIRNSGANIYYAAVNEKDGNIYTTTSRAAGVVALGNTIEEAEKSVESALLGISGRVYVRHDIAKMETINKKIQKVRDILE